jgi:ribosomal protein S18 acetylase RimI-like enzyme
MVNDVAPAIVPVEVQDIPDIQNIARKTWAATYAGLIPEDVQELLLNNWYSNAGLDQLIRSNRTIFLLARVAQRPVGFAQFVQFSPDAATLSRIYVLPEYQNRRIGSKLLDAAMTSLKTAGVKTVLVTVERDNQIGRRFYARKTFKEVSESALDLAGHQLPVVTCELAI